MEEQPRIALADYLQESEIETHILVQEEDSVRADWWRASCGLHDWYTTGSRPNVEDAAAHHVAWDHTACAALDPDSPADAPLYCRMLPGHGDDHANGGRCWANDRPPAVTPNRREAAAPITRPASHYFADERSRKAFLALFGDELDAWFTPDFAQYVRTGSYPAAGGVQQPETSISAAPELEEIRARNRRLADVPFQTHGTIHGRACIPCELVRAISDVTALLEIVDGLSAVPDTTPFAMQQPEYEAENRRLWEDLARANLARGEADLRVAQLRLVLSSTLRAFTKKRRRRGRETLRTNWIEAATIERGWRVFEETRRTGAPGQLGRKP